MNGAQLLVKALENEKVEYIFGIPGEENILLLEALSDSKIRFVTTRHEQGAAFMAATYGRLTGRAGVVLTTLGPGFTNAITGLAHARLGGMPLILISAQKSRESMFEGRFQQIDAPEISRTLTKISQSVSDVSLLPAAISNAFKVATLERPGVVHLEIGENILSSHSDIVPLAHVESRRATADMKSINLAAEMIRNCKRPLLLVGAGANRNRISKELTNFIKHSKIPFITTALGKGVVAEDSPFYKGTVVLSERDPLHMLVERSDLLITVGHELFEKPLSIAGGESKRVLSVSFYPTRIDPNFVPSCEVVGDVANSLAILSGLVEEDRGGWESEVERSREEIDDLRINLQPIVDAVRDSLPKDGIVVLDNGLYKLQFARGYKTYLPNTLLMDNTLASMGVGLPGAICAKLLNPKKDVVAVCGDGGFMMSVAELESAVRLKLNMTILLLQDDGYGMIEWKAREEGIEPFGVRFGNPDFVKLAESFGGNGYMVENKEQLEKLLVQVIPMKGVKIVVVPIRY